MLNHLGTQTVNSERLIIRVFQYTDNDDMLTYWVSDPKIQSLYSELAYTTKEEVEGLLDTYIGSYSRLDYYRWAIIEKESDTCIGQIAIFLVSPMIMKKVDSNKIRSDFHILVLPVF